MRGVFSSFGFGIILLSGWLLLMSSGCSDEPVENSPTPTPTPLPPEDQSPPSLTLLPLEQAPALSTELPISVQVQDPSGVASVSLFYRAPGAAFWASTFMSPGAEQPDGTTVWFARIPASFLQPPGVEYYVQALDASLNRNKGFAPAGGADAPAFAPLALPSADFPFYEGFEPPEGNTAPWTLEDTGWKESVQGFNDLENWQLSEQQAGSGRFSAYHGHGSPFQTGPFDDWLLSPTLDLTSASAVDLYWLEVADLGQYAEHQLLISVGSPDPAAGEFVVVESLLDAPPELEQGFARSRHVDLSAYAGMSGVTLAFRYLGLWGDDWYLDDVTLEVPRSDLRVSPVLVSPAEVQPGDSALLSFTLENVGLVASEGLTITLSSEDVGVGFPQPVVTLNPLPAGGLERIDGLEVQVSGDHLNHTYIPIMLTVSDETQTLTQRAQVQVGRPARAFIQLTHSFQDDIQLWLGYGDPESPTFETLVAADEGGDASGTFSYEVDLSAQQGAFPPDYGAHRWYLKVQDDSVANTGTVDVFRLELGDEVYSTEGLPQPIPDDLSFCYVFLPGKAALELREARSTPEEVSPGAPVSLQLSLNNRAAPPAGEVTGVLSSSDPHVLGLSGVPIVFDRMSVADYVGASSTSSPSPSPSVTPSPSPTVSQTPTLEPLPTASVTPSMTPVASVTPEPSPDTEEGGVFEVWVARAPFTFQVSGAHTNALPLALMLTLTDGVDIWQVPVEVGVPWPVLGGASVLVEDTVNGVVGDGALNPGESAQLRVRVRNAGTKTNFGPVRVTLSLLSGSTARLSFPTEPFTLQDDSGDGLLEPGEGAKSSPLPVTVLSGGSGDVLRFGLLMEDGALSVEEERQLTLDAVPFNPVLVLDDVSGDQQEATVDLRSGEFRRQGNLLTMRWRSHTPFELDQTAVYVYLSSSGVYQYAIYAADPAVFLVWTSTGDSGYWYRRYTPPTSMKVGQLDPYTVEVQLDLSQVGLSSTPLWGGASTGSCGGIISCDYAPDGEGIGAGQLRFYW